MSRARDLADLLDANGDVAIGALDNVPPSNDASALTTGTLPIARIADGAITSAKIANGVIPDGVDTGSTAARPATPAAGKLYYNTDTNSIQIYNGSWNELMEVPTVSGGSGDIYVGNASNITLTVSGFVNPVTVDFYEGNTLVASQTGLTASSNSVTAAVPSDVYNKAAGTVITATVRNPNGTRASASQSFTVQEIITGGTRTVSGGYVYHAFTSSGTLTVPSGMSKTAEVLIVGGGGSGGTGSYGAGANSNGAGGGAGGVRHLSSQSITAGSYSVVIGGGGAGVAPQNNPGNNGSGSSAFGSTANGGNKNSGLTGGSSGSPTTNSGGGGGSYSGGGGGGAGGGGVGGGGNAKKAGGTGVYYANFTSWGAEAQSGDGVNLSPSPNGYFGGGGEGAGASGDGTRAAGGGGSAKNEFNSSSSVNAGIANTGGGGAGGYAQEAYSGNGGSGIVLIRYAV